jgi:hypothetical protein
VEVCLIRKWNIVNDTSLFWAHSANATLGCLFWTINLGNIQDKSHCNGLSLCMLVSSTVIEIKILLICQILDHFVCHPVQGYQENYYSAGSGCVVSTPILYSGGPGFISQRGNQLSFQVFHGIPQTLKSIKYFKISPWSLELLITNGLIIWHYTMSVYKSLPLH